MSRAARSSLNLLFVQCACSMFRERSQITSGGGKG